MAALIIVAVLLVAVLVVPYVKPGVASEAVEAVQAVQVVPSVHTEQPVPLMSTATMATAAVQQAAASAPASTRQSQVPRSTATSLPSVAPSATVSPVPPSPSATAVVPTLTPTAIPTVQPVVIPQSTSEPANEPAGEPASEPASEPTPTVQPVVIPEPPSEPTAPPVPTERPVSMAAITRLVIPSIGVDAGIEVLSLDANGNMEDPTSPDVVAWYNFSSRPADDGNVVFAGHLDSAAYGPAVFWDLDALQPGALIEVYQDDGVVVTYAVTSVRPFAATDDATALVSSVGRPTITLITCGGDFDRAAGAYINRTVVTGDRVD